MKKSSLYVVFIAEKPSLLQLRTNLDWLESYRLEKNDRKELVLKIPPPIINVASGDSEVVLNISHSLFQTPTELKNWKYCGDYFYAFLLQKGREDD